MGSRVEAIKAMLQKEPGDVFLHYSLGMEYASAGQFDEAVAELNTCIDLDENYLSAYVEAGKCLRSAGERAAAREMFLRGLELASVQGEQHVHDFLQQQLSGLGDAGGR